MKPTKRRHCRKQPQIYKSWRAITSGDQLKMQGIPCTNIRFVQNTNQWRARLQCILRRGCQDSRWGSQEKTHRASLPFLCFPDACFRVLDGLAYSLGTTLSQDTLIRNDLLRFYTMCPKYTQTVVENQTWKTLQEDFQTGQRITNLRRTISNRLNLQGISQLTLGI